MKLLKLRSLMITGILAVTMLVPQIGPMVYAKNDENAIKSAFEQKVKTVLTNGYSQYYKINNIQVRFDDVEVNGTHVSATLLASMNNTLKMSKVEELPYVQGMLKKLNLDGFTYESKAKLDDAIVKANTGKLKNDQIAKASKELNYKLNDLKKYINQASDVNMYLKVSADLSNGVVSQDSVIVLAENADKYVPIKDLLPKSSEDMINEGSNDMQLAMDTETSEFTPKLYASYNPSDARYYSSIYATNPTSCYDHGTSCGILQARNTWNNYQYNYYSNLCHNDCADFVSQALSYGGIPEDLTVWYGTKYTTTRSLAWVNTASLKTFMSNNDYWRSTTFSSATEGAVMYTASDHVVMIAQNDSITHTYNGHTNDRYRTAFSNSASFEYYKLW